MPVMRKMFNGFIAMALTVVGNKRFNPKIIADPDFIKITNVDEKMTGCIAGLLLTKSKFYFAWSISDAMCNVAGFGYRRPDTDEDDEDDDLSLYSRVGGSKRKCRDEDLTSNIRSEGTKAKDEPSDEDLSQYKAVPLSSCGSRGTCKHEGSTKVKADEVSMRSSVVRVNFEFEARDSTHQDWNEFHFHQEEEYDGWEVTSNIRPSGIELAPNLRSVTDNWNIQTHNWVKYVCYDRTPASINLTMSYILIALWHGFYPGYWISFVQATLLTKTSRLVRRVVRPYFLSPGEDYNTLSPEPTIKKRYYDFLTWFTTTLFIAYNMAPFFLLEFGASVAFYRSVGWIGHIVVGSAFVVLSIIDRQTNVAPKEGPMSLDADATSTVGGLEGFEATWSASSVPSLRRPSTPSLRKTSTELKLD